MSFLKRHTSLFLLVLGWMWIYRLPDGSALAEVKDNTGMFSASAIQQADEQTRQIKQKYGREMLVEVFPEIPAELRGNYSPDRKDTFFADWMKRRAQELKVNGIYVLICRDPSHLQVDATGNTRQRAFTPANIEQLKNILVSRFRDKQFDEGLLEGVGYVDRTLATNIGSSANANANSGNPQYAYQTPGGGNQGRSGVAAAPAQQQKTGIGWIWWVAIIGLGIFVVSRILRARSGMQRGFPVGPAGGYPPGTYPQGQYPQGQYPPQSGGFGKGIMGGLLGGMAGGWLFDKMSHRGQSGSGYGSGYSDPNAMGGGTSPGLGDDPGQGFTGGSGGDFGGGDSGSSGGDFGGGGGDSGGGGGDGGSGGDF